MFERHVQRGDIEIAFFHRLAADLARSGPDNNPASRSSPLTETVWPEACAFRQGLVDALRPLKTEEPPCFGSSVPRNQRYKIGTFFDVFLDFQPVSVTRLEVSLVESYVDLRTIERIPHLLGNWVILAGIAKENAISLELRHFGDMRLLN
jgi:hypothetical protein